MIVVGLDELKATLARFGGRAPQAAGAALYAEGELIMTSAKEITPVLTGALRGSGHVQLPEIHGTEVQVTLGFGGPAASYAVRQHEVTWYNHPRGGQAKFLEKPFVAAATGFTSRLATRLRQLFREGF